MNEGIYLILLTIIPAILSVAIIIQSAMQRKERRELINRLMARSLAEYKAEEEGREHSHDRLSRHREVIKRWRQGGGDS